MKKNVNGLRYDTDKAILIGEASSLVKQTEYVDDFSHWFAGLYRTQRSGRYFLAGRGGPMSRFAKSAGQKSWSGGEDIIPMSRQEALEWAEYYLTAEIIEQHFIDDVEDA